MSDYFSLLSETIHSPSNAYHTGTDKAWQEFEKKTGIYFPTDYKKLINKYGTGGLNNFVWFLTPFDTDENVNFMKRSKQMLDAYKISRKQFPDYFQFHVYPEPNGLLPWGYTDNGDELYWKTNCFPDSWEIVLYESASPIYYHYKFSLSELLYKTITNQIYCSILSDSLSCQSIEYIAVNVKQA